MTFNAINRRQARDSRVDPACFPPGAEVLPDTVAVNCGNGSLLFVNPGAPVLRPALDGADQARLASMQLLESETGEDLKVGALAGVLLLVPPAVMAQGLHEVGQHVYGALNNEFCQLNSVLPTLVPMVLLRIRGPERLPLHATGEFKLGLGLDRSPRTKTVRRKLAEPGARGWS